MKTVYELAKLTGRQKRIIDALVPPTEESPLKKLCEIVFADEEMEESECMD